MAFFVVSIQETWKDWRQANTWNIRTQMGGGDLMTNKFMTWPDISRLEQYFWGILVVFHLAWSPHLCWDWVARAFYCFRIQIPIASSVKKHFLVFLERNKNNKYMSQFNIAHCLFSEMKRLTIKAKILIDALLDSRLSQLAACPH